MASAMWPIQRCISSNNDSNQNRVEKNGRGGGGGVTAAQFCTKRIIQMFNC